LACIVSNDGYSKKINPAWETTLGYTREEVLSTMLDFIHPDDLERTLNKITKLHVANITRQNFQFPERAVVMLHLLLHPSALLGTWLASVRHLEGGWQGFQAVRNALLPGNNAGIYRDCAAHHLYCPRSGSDRPHRAAGTAQAQQSADKISTSAKLTAQ
jgi:hypothetical protein